MWGERVAGKRKENTNRKIGRGEGRWALTENAKNLRGRRTDLRRKTGRDRIAREYVSQCECECVCDCDCVCFVKERGGMGGEGREGPGRETCSRNRAVMSIMVMASMKPTRTYTSCAYTHAHAHAQTPRHPHTHTPTHPHTLTGREGGRGKSRKMLIYIIRPCT